MSKPRKITFTAGCQRWNHQSRIAYVGKQLLVRLNQTQHSNIKAGAAPAAELLIHNLLDYGAYDTVMNPIVHRKMRLFGVGVTAHFCR
jgi:hypothetical protein